MTTGSIRSIGLALASLSIASAAAAQTEAALSSGSAPIAASAPTATTAQAALMIVTGGSTVIQTDFPIKRFAVTNPAIADATVVDPKQLLVDGKTAGSVSLIVWGESRLLHYEVNVHPPTSSLQRELRLLFPSEEISVGVADEAIVLSGRVSSNVVARHALEIAEKSSSKSKVINMLQLPGSGESQQVMLQVKVAEVDQRAMLELGSTLFTGPSGYHNWVGRSSTEQFPAPDFTDRLGPPPASNPQSEGKLSFTDFLNLFVLNTKYDIGAVIQALKSRGYFQNLAEPTLIAYNGQEASFLAGGEVPVPIAQGITGAVTVTYKEFGVRLTFRPTITGDLIRLKVKPEVSSLDFSNGITMQGFRIPALTTRRAETDVELRDGQSFAIGGLLNNLSQTDRAAIPWIGSVPIIGNLFKSKAERKERTELVVLITPHLVRPLDPNQVPPLPTRPDRFLIPGRDDTGRNDAGPDARPTAADGGSETAAPAPAPKVCVAVWCS